MCIRDSASPARHDRDAGSRTADGEAMMPLKKFMHTMIEHDRPRRGCGSAALRTFLAAVAVLLAVGCSTETGELGQATSSETSSRASKEKRMRSPVFSMTLKAEEPARRSDL